MSKIKSAPKFPRNEVLDRQVEQYVKTKTSIRAGKPGKGNGSGQWKDDPVIVPLYGVVISTDV
jgi:hypothetical protein